MQRKNPCNCYLFLFSFFSTANLDGRTKVVSLEFLTFVKLDDCDLIRTHWKTLGKKSQSKISCLKTKISCTLEKIVMAEVSKLINLIILYCKFNLIRAVNKIYRKGGILLKAIYIVVAET